MVKLLKAGIKL